MPDANPDRHVVKNSIELFDREEEIELGAIAAELQSMERAMEENDRMIQGFCEELGIEVPF